MMGKIRSLLFSQTSRDALVSFTGLGTIAVVGMVFTVITARALGPAQFGLFSTLNAFTTLLSSMGDLGISSALVNFIPKTTDRRNIIISTTFWFQISVSFILTSVLIVAGLIPDLIIPGSRPIHFVIIGILTGLYVLQGFALGIFNAEKKFLQASFIQGFDSMVKLGLVTALFFGKSLNVELALLANVLSCFLSVIYGFSNELRNIRPIFPRSQVLEIFRFAKWIAISKTFSVMISRIDVILINLLVSGFQAGIFSAASRISLLFALLVSSLGSVVAPRFSVIVNRNDLKSYMKKVSLLVSGVSLLMISTTVFADILVKTIFGLEYVAAIPVFRAMTVAMIPFLLSVAVSQPLIYSFNQPSFMSKVTIFQVTTLIALDFLLIPHFQALGPTISLGITNSAVLLISGRKLYNLMK